MNNEAQEVFDRLEKLKELVQVGDIEKLVPWQQDGSFRAITFDRHLFYPELLSNLVFRHVKRRSG